MVIIIIPCFNEATRLQADPFISFLETTPGIHILFVDDGSRDQTYQIIHRIEALAKGRVSHIKLPRNMGKAEAVRQGVLWSVDSGHRFIGFWDADLATPLSEIPYFVALLEQDAEKKVVFGSRIQRLGAKIHRRWYRHYLGRVIATCISLILKIPVYDSQCGAKLFDAELAKELFAQPFISTWLFDVEIIARVIGKLGRERTKTVIYERPLTAWRDIDDSKIRLSYIPKIPLELGRIFRHYREQLKD